MNTTRQPWHVRRRRLQKVAARLDVTFRWWWPNWFIRSAIINHILRNNGTVSFRKEPIDE